MEHNPLRPVSRFALVAVLLIVPLAGCSNSARPPGIGNGPLPVATIPSAPPDGVFASKFDDTEERLERCKATVERLKEYVYGSRENPDSLSLNLAFEQLAPYAETEADHDALMHVANKTIYELAEGAPEVDQAGAEAMVRVCPEEEEKLANDLEGR